MKKKLLILGAVIAVISGVVGMSAFEAHIINVTAHIENGLKVATDPISFGTVFPQEYIEKSFEINLSDSFKGADRVDDVKYVINQKLKPCPLIPGITPAVPIDPTCVPDTPDATPENPTGWHYLSLCPFLSKTNNDPDGTLPENDVSHPSYFVAAVPEVPAHCQTVTTQASGALSKLGQDISDTWIVDLKVPPVAGSVSQDWPAGCPTILDNDKTYGCDLWVEVTEISTTPNPTPTPTPTATPTPGTVITSVNIGDPASENSFDMLGWSTTIWPGGGGGWGGGDDGTIRTVSAGTTPNTDLYKAAYPTDDPDSAIIAMNFGAASATKMLNIRHLDGGANDSFNVYVDGTLIGNYADSTAVETWMTTGFSVNAYNGSHIIRIQLTGPHWASYATFGQLGISWIQIVN